MEWAGREGGKGLRWGPFFRPPPPHAGKWRRWQQPERRPEEAAGAAEAVRPESLGGRWGEQV